MFAKQLIMLCVATFFTGFALEAKASTDYPTETRALDAAREMEYQAIFGNSSTPWDWRTQVPPSPSSGPGEVVAIVFVYPNGDQLAEIMFTGDSNRYRVLIHLDGTVTLTGNGLDGKPICQCNPGCVDVGATRDPNKTNCGGIVQQNPEDGKKHVICNEDDPVCD